MSRHNSSRRAGDLILTPPSEVHQNWVSDGQSVSFLSLYIDDRALTKAVFEITGRSDLATGPVAHGPGRNSTETAFLRIYSAMESCASRLEPKRPCWNWWNCCLPLRLRDRRAGAQYAGQTSLTHALHCRTCEPINFIGRTRKDCRSQSVPLAPSFFATDRDAAARLSDLAAHQPRQATASRAFPFQKSRPRPDLPTKVTSPVTSAVSLAFRPAATPPSSNPHRKNVQDATAAASVTMLEA